MKKHPLILCFVFLAIYASAQDQLFKRDNSKLLVKIIEIAPDEIRYKLYDNLDGPVHVTSKRQVALIIFENGKHEVFSEPAAAEKPQVNREGIPYKNKRVMDSAGLYKYTSSIALNFFNFFNTELGLIYQKEFFRRHFNLTIPVAVGFQTPSVTEATYFSSNNVKLNRKLFEVGIGLHYYPTLRYPVNYYIGPDLRFIQYSCYQAYHYSVPTGKPSPAYTQQLIEKNGELSRYCMSITNGFIVRTRSRLTFNAFISMGFKSDVSNINIIDPSTQRKVETVLKPGGFYFWSGFAIGYSF